MSINESIKGSRYHTKRPRHGFVGRSWHQVYKHKLMRRNVDFFVFVTYIPRTSEYKIAGFDKKFLIVPCDELIRRVEAKQAGKRGVYSFYFHFDGKKITDLRDWVGEDERFDYSKFLDRWDLIEDFFKATT